MAREAQGMARAVRAGRAADGSFRGPNVTLRAVGICGSRLKETPRPGADALVVVAGLGGGLDPGLRTGDLVLDDPEGLIAQPTGGVLGAARRGRIFTSPRILESPRAKKIEWQETGAACVDMEQEVVQRWLGRPVVGLRVVLDTAMQVLDPKFGTLCDDLGNVRPRALLRYLVTNPTAIVPMMEIGRANAASMKMLGEALREIVS